MPSPLPQPMWTPPVASSLPHCTADPVAWRSNPVGGGPRSMLSSGAPGSLLRVIPTGLHVVLMGSSRRVPGPRTKGCGSWRACRTCGGWRGRVCWPPSTCPPSRSSATSGVSVRPGPRSCVWKPVCRPLAFPGGSDGEESACSAELLGSIPASGRSPGGGHGDPLQDCCLENPMDRGAREGYGPWGHTELNTADVR